jgi:hypothetical protein
VLVRTQSPTEDRTGRDNLAICVYCEILVTETTTQEWFLTDFPFSIREN